MNKIMSFENPTTQGVTLHFEAPFALNGGLKSATWFVSWERLSDLIQRGLK